LSESFLSLLEKKITRISDREYDPKFFSFEKFLVTASHLYQNVSILRLKLYRTGRLKSKRLPCFVISIGNIMAGGVGKTPMAIYIAELLMKMGRRPVVISRGYQGNLGADAGVVGDGEAIFLDALAAGDEPHMMARRKTFPVVVGKDRYLAGKLALERLNIDVIVLDDGFAHLGLERDLNLLLFDHDRPLGNNRVLPAGRLRETPAMSKPRAHAIVLTRSPEGEKVGQPEEVGQPEVSQREKTGLKEKTCQIDITRQYDGLPLFKTSHQPFLLDILPGKKGVGPGSQTLDSLKGRSCVLFSGIANNSSFRSAAEELGVNVVDHLEFKDHYRYKRADILRIQTRAREMGTHLIVTTEKDWVKLDRQIQWDADLAVVGVKIRFEDPSAFEGFIRSRLNE
jgi:tetraacyldisaccharide 4'-kinase